jgi:putative phosphoribosyl transferase
MYQDRQEAGEQLADVIAARMYVDVSILAVPRGGIVIAASIARRLGIKLEVLVTRKIGHPANPEVAIGAVMADGSAVLDEKLISTFAISREYLKEAIAREYGELKRRMVLYSGSDSPPPVTGKTAIIVDDGIATGYTVRAAVSWLKSLNPAKIVIAVPVAPPETVLELANQVDEIICPLQPEDFMAVGRYYHHFAQNTDAEVMDILKEINNTQRGLV